jgi:hypothetical protein
MSAAVLIPVPLVRAAQPRPGRRGCRRGRRLPDAAAVVTRVEVVEVAWPHWLGPISGEISASI